MKKVICFTESLAGGGAEHQMAILSGFLAGKGYSVELVTYASIPDHYETPTGVKRLDIGETVVKRKSVKAFIKALKVFFYFLNVNTDCVISYRQRANFRVLWPLLFRSRRIKVICSERNITVRTNLVERLLFGFLYKRADYIVPNSETQRQYIARVKPSLKSKLHTIHNYTDLEHFAVSRMPEDMKIVKVAIFSRYSEQKNPNGFAIAMKRLKKLSKVRFEVHWYGEQSGNIDGHNEAYLRIKRKVDDMDLDDVFKLYPAVLNPADYMDRYHAVCLPSLYEGFSNSVAEGICCGKPMLVSDVSDNYVMVHDGENGFLFNPQSCESICAAFQHFFELSYNEMLNMGNLSRQIAEKLFDKNHFIQQYLDLVDL